MLYFNFFTLFVLTCFTATHSHAKKNIWVYTSIYKEFASPLKKAFELKHPDIEVGIFQAGSEKIQAKFEAELLARKPQADLIILSDPFWAMDLKKRGLLFSTPKRDSIQTNYYSLMVLVSHKDVPSPLRPRRFSDLIKPEFKNQIQLGSPLESGTSFATVAYLSQKYGWDYFDQLRQNQVASNGGNSTVIQKIELGEKKFGIVLLENALASQKRGSPIEIIYPEDGSIPIPSIQIILNTSPSINEAQLFAQFVLSTEGQNLLRAGFMHSVIQELPPPMGALPYKIATQASTPWTEAQISKVSSSIKDIKRKFSELILE